MDNNGPIGLEQKFCEYLLFSNKIVYDDLAEDRGVRTFVESAFLYSLCLSLVNLIENARRMSSHSTDLPRDTLYRESLSQVSHNNTVRSRSFLHPYQMHLFHFI